MACGQTVFMNPTPTPSPFELLRVTAWDRALHTYGTAYIFDARGKRLKRKMTRLTFAGIAIPAVVGGIALGGIPLPWLLPVALVVAAALGILQLVASIWAFAADWSGSFAQTTQSMTTNQQLTDSYKRLGESPPEDLTQFQHELALVRTQDIAQQDRDRLAQVTHTEERMGLRAALRERRQACTSCTEIPTSMTPSSCEVCGDFPKRWIK